MSSKVWKYFEKQTKASAKCKLCFKTIKSSGNTTNYQKHLKSVHKDAYDALEPAPSTSSSIP